VIDLDVAGGTLKFVKNLPGFGPTALLDGCLREEFCFTAGARTCGASVQYKSPIPRHDP